MDEFIYKVEGYKIIGCFYAVYNTLGPGFLEAVYQEALEKEFIKRDTLYFANNVEDVLVNKITLLELEKDK